jgi:hypothetical protein
MPRACAEMTPRNSARPTGRARAGNSHPPSAPALIRTRSPSRALRPAASASLAAQAQTLDCDLPTDHFGASREDEQEQRCSQPEPGSGHGALHLPSMNGQEGVAYVRVPANITHCWRCALGRCARRWKPPEAGDRDMPGGPGLLTPVLVSPGDLRWVHDENRVDRDESVCTAWQITSS